jgi:hypothetical protein
MATDKQLERMSLEDLDAELAKADDAATEAFNYKRKVGAMVQEKRQHAATVSVLEGMDDQQRAILLAELQSGRSAVAATSTVAVSMKGTENDG